MFVDCGSYNIVLFGIFAGWVRWWTGNSAPGGESGVSAGWPDRSAAVSSRRIAPDVDFGLPSRVAAVSIADSRGHAGSLGRVWTERTTPSSTARTSLDYPNETVS